VEKKTIVAQDQGVVFEFIHPMVVTFSPNDGNFHRRDAEIAELEIFRFPLRGRGGK